MIYLPHKDYFEGILQLRGNFVHLLPWVKDTVKNDARSAITKEKKVKGGLDLYFSSQRYLQALGKKIKHRWVGVLKVSVRLHTKSKLTQRELFRVTVLFKALPFNKGDVIRYRGEEYQLMNAENKAVLKHVQSGKKIFVSMDDLDKARLVEPSSE